MSRFKICLFELGDGKLSAEDIARIQAALHAEAVRLQSVAAEIDFDEPQAFSQPLATT